MAHGSQLIVKIMNEIIKIISNEFRAIGTNIPILIVLILGNVGYGFLYNLLYNTNVYKEAPIAIVDMSTALTRYVAKATRYVPDGARK